MKKFFTKNVIAALIALLVAIGGVFGFTISEDASKDIEALAIKKLVPKE